MLMADQSETNLPPHRDDRAKDGAIPSQRYGKGQHVKSNSQLICHSNSTNDLIVINNVNKPQPTDGIDFANFNVQKHPTKHRKINKAESSNNTYASVVPKNSKRNPFTVGNTILTNLVLPLKAMPKTTAINVYRFDPDTETNHILNYIKPAMPVLNVEKLECRKSKIYASFTMTINK
ncbi:hypothetical protein HHI36_023966 [Cryptolaemus montrouzieri]|uniref:Uncharacterized protein n=1 Tax=Cryptolaemus montrouzieri TaxID=559131 RepID=A0ABD2NY93_9CUCU